MTADTDDAAEEGDSSSQRYRTTNRGGLGVRDIKTTERNGPVIGISAIHEDDDPVMPENVQDVPVLKLLHNRRAS